MSPEDPKTARSGDRGATLAPTTRTRTWRRSGRRVACDVAGQAALAIQRGTAAFRLREHDSNTATTASAEREPHGRTVGRTECANQRSCAARRGIAIQRPSRLFVGERGQQRRRIARSVRLVEHRRRAFDDAVGSALGAGLIKPDGARGHHMTNAAAENVTTGLDWTGRLRITLRGRTA